ncbi:hypothetical protein GH714_016785 [Hevea brasiliensis]|uniref:Uncharacterized protein n=1 Tax=Hevea brasiliensis TaxID=3981 RepID=A0A6A6LPI8_HEVBR|nr:hypothetical protein GH714_016785 [Hevea brasiliensis]
MPNSAYVLIPSDNSYSNDPEVVTGTSKRANGMSKGILPEVGIQEANLAVGGENEERGDQTDKNEHVAVVELKSLVEGLRFPVSPLIT